MKTRYFKTKCRDKECSLLASKPLSSTDLRMEQHFLEKESAQKACSSGEEYPPLPEVMLVEKRSPECSQLNVQALNTHSTLCHTLSVGVIIARRKLL